MMRLHYAETLCPRRADTAARHLGLPVEFVRVDLGRGKHKQPRFLALNPNGTVPVLEDGALRLWEANAIICHLAMRAGSDLWPGNAAGQVEAIRWMSWEADVLNRHAGELYFQHLIRARFGLGDPDPAAIATATQGFRDAASVLEAHLDRRDWILGERLSVADFAVAAALPYAEAADIPLRDFPRIAAWHARLDRLSAWREPFPEAGPGGDAQAAEATRR